MAQNRAFNYFEEPEDDIIGNQHISGSNGGEYDSSPSQSGDSIHLFWPLQQQHQQQEQHQQQQQQQPYISYFQIQTSYQGQPSHFAHQQIERAAPVPAINPMLISPVQQGSPSMESPGQPPKPLFQCPIWKMDVLRGHRRQCKGSVAENMAGVRRHIQRSHSRFVKLCKTCNEDILDEETFETLHGDYCSSAKSQRRGKEAEQQWVALCRKLYPTAPELPTPYGQVATPSPSPVGFGDPNAWQPTSSQMTPPVYPGATQYQYPQGYTYGPGTHYTQRSGDAHSEPVIPSSIAQVGRAENSNPAVYSVQCPHCHTILTGPHANGNLTRHQKSQECASSHKRKEYPCDFEGCGKVYQRSDGLLNHKRKRHGAPGPLRRDESAGLY